jgi:hypothetical protein
MDMKKKMPHKNVTLKRHSLLRKESCSTGSTEAIRKQPKLKLKRANRHFGKDISNEQKLETMEEEQSDMV